MKIAFEWKGLQYRADVTKGFADEGGGWYVGDLEVDSSTGEDMSHYLNDAAWDEIEEYAIELAKGE